jgi:DNA-binding beta-propeller fold protein YncE
MSLDTDLTVAEQPAQLPVVMPSQPHASEPGIDLSEPQPLNLSYFVPPQTRQAALTPQHFAHVPFADLPLYIPGLTQNVQGFDGGINKAALDVHRDNGLLCNLLPYLDMAQGDFVELFCNDLNDPVTLYNVTQDDVDKARIIPLYITRTRLPEGPANPVFMRVSRIGGGVEETARLNLKVDTVPPAGRNPVASTLHNENLPIPMFPQAIIDFGVSETDAQNGVPVTFRFYPVDDTQAPNTYRAARDRIRLSVGGAFATIPPVTEGQAAGREDITVVLYDGFWRQVRSGSHVCEYEIIDEVGNASQGWSPALLLNVRLNDGAEPLLPVAFFLEAPLGSIDHDALDGRDATLFISTPSPDFIFGDRVRVTVNGRAVDGSKIITTYDSAAIVSPSFITLPCPNADLRKLIGGWLQLSYERIRDGVPNRHSIGSLVSVTGTPIETGLLAPEVIEAIGGILDPHLLSITVRVPIYDGRQSFDLVMLILSGVYANGDNYYAEIDRTAGSGEIVFRINNGPDGAIAKLEGGTLRFLYQVINADGTRTSLDETVNVGGPVATLPEPQVQEAPAPLYQFDPEVSTGDANVLVRSNIDFQEGDIVTLHCQGSAAEGSAPPQPFPILNFWVGRSLPFILERQYITPNLNKTMRLYYTRERAGAPTRISHAVNIKVGSRLELHAPTVVEATSVGENIARLNPLHVLPPHSPVVTIRVISNAFPPSADIKVMITGKPGVGMPDIPAKPALPEPGENYTSFTVPNAFVGAYLAGECQVFYNLLEIGKSSKSAELTLQVEALPEQALDLVSIPEAAAGVINASVSNNVRIDAWPFMRAGQLVWIELESSNGNLTVRNATAVTAAEFTAKRTLDGITANYLRGLPDNSSVTVRAAVSLDGMSAINTAIPLGLAGPYRVRKTTGEIVRTIFVADGPECIRLTPDGTQAYVTYSRTRETTTLDAVNQRHLRTTGHSTGTSHGLAPHPTQPWVYFVFGGSYIYKISTTNGTIEKVTNWGNGTYGLDINSFGSDLFITNTNVLGTGTWSMNTISNAVKGTYVGPQNYAVKCSPDDNFLFTVGSHLRRFEIQNGLRTHELVMPSICRGLAHSPLNSKLMLIVAETGNHRIGIYDTRNGLVLIKHVENIRSPWEVVFHPTKNIAYVTASGENSLKIIDTSTLDIIDSIPGFNQPQGLDITPNGRFLFVCNGGGNTVSIVQVD